MDKRRRPRTKIRLPVRFGLEKPDTLGFITDISLGGVHIATNAVLPPGSSIALQIELPGGGVLALRGHVIRARRVPSSLVTLVRGGMGIRLDSPPINWRDTLTLPVED